MVKVTGTSRGAVIVIYNSYSGYCLRMAAMTAQNGRLVDVALIQ